MADGRLRTSDKITGREGGGGAGTPQCNWARVSQIEAAFPCSVLFKMAAKYTCRAVGISALFLLIAVAILPAANAGGKTLVLLDNANTKDTHSIFFNTMKGEFG